MSVCGGGGGMGLVNGVVADRPIPPRVQIDAQLIVALLSDAALVEDDVDGPIIYSFETAWTFSIRLSRYVWW